jgi:hypothetical protein
MVKRHHSLWGRLCFLSLVAVVGSLVVLVAAVIQAGVNGEMGTLADVGDVIEAEEGILFIIIASLIVFVLFGVIALAQRMHSSSGLDSRVRHIFSHVQRKQVLDKYHEVQILVERGGPSAYRSAILAMDVLLDYTLSCLGYEGSLGEKLKQTDHLFTDIDAVWRAHKHRNRLVHEMSYEPLKPEVEESISILTRALQELGILEE